MYEYQWYGCGGEWVKVECWGGQADRWQAKWEQDRERQAEALYGVAGPRWFLTSLPSAPLDKNTSHYWESLWGPSQKQSTGLYSYFLLFHSFYCKYYRLLKKHPNQFLFICNLLFFLSFCCLSFNIVLTLSLLLTHCLTITINDKCPWNALFHNSLIFESFHYSPHKLH